MSKYRSVGSRWLNLAAALALVGMSAVAMAGSENGTSDTNPYAPAYGHPYRHGAVPSREAHSRMTIWASLHAAKPTGSSGKTLGYGGGVDGIGVTSGTPRVYIVFFGSQWGSSGSDNNGNLVFANDPNNAAPYVQNLMKGLGTGGELWSGTMTQYCDGSQVSSGATFCPSGAAHVGYPTNGRHRRRVVRQFGAIAGFGDPGATRSGGGECSCALRQYHGELEPLRAVRDPVTYRYHAGRVQYLPGQLLCVALLTPRRATVTWPIPTCPTSAMRAPAVARTS